MVEVRGFSFFYGEKQALFDITMEIPEQQVTAFIGPSGCGKTTLLRNLNRMNDLIDGIRHEGEILLDGTSLYDPSVEVISLRKRVGMVFQKYNPFAEVDLRERRISAAGGGTQQPTANSTKWSSAACAARRCGTKSKDRLHESAYGLSGGQQQRLCIARAIANRPQILLMDEPCAPSIPSRPSRSRNSSRD